LRAFLRRNRFGKRKQIHCGQNDSTTTASIGGKMETQTESQSQPQTQSENAIDRFIRKKRELFAKESDIDKRWNALRPILAELLADPQVIAAAKQWPDCVPANGRAENLLFYEDPDYGFAINGLTKGESRQGGRARIPRPRPYLHTLRRARRT